MKVKATENTSQLPRLLILSDFGDLTVILNDQVIMKLKQSFETQLVIELRPLKHDWSFN